MMKRLFVFALALLLSACVSTHMKQFVGKDIREVMVADGPPVNQFDMGDGRRAFQWYIGGGSYVVPQTTTGTVTNIGNQSYVNATTTGGHVVSSAGCLVTYFARYDATKDAWIVGEFTYPDRLVC